MVGVRGPCTLRRNTHTHTLMHTHSSMQTQMNCGLVLLSCIFPGEKSGETFSYRTVRGRRKRRRMVSGFGLDGTTGKVASTADGRETRVCVCVCMLVIFASRTPFPAFPACPPTQHMSSSPLLSFLLSPPNPSNLPIFCRLISTNYPREYKCGRYACLCRSECPLCFTLALSDVFISINAHTVPFSLCSQTLIKGVFDFFFCCPGPTCPSRVGV